MEEILMQPSMGTRQAVEVSHVVMHLPDEFHLLLQEAALPEVTELGVCQGRTQGMQIWKA